MKVWVKKRVQLNGRPLKRAFYITFKIDEDKVGPGLGDDIAKHVKDTALGERLHATLHPLGEFEAIPLVE